MHAARYGCVRYGGSAGGWIKVRSKIIGTCYGSTDLCIRKLRADLFQGKETLLLFTGTEMSKNNDIITTVATAGGPMAFHGATSGGQFKMLTYMISQSLAESLRRVYLNTYRQWWAFAERHRLDYLDIRYENILAFLNQIDVAYATRQSWKTHMLRLLDWLEESETRGEWYAKQRRRVLKFVKVKRMNAERGGHRSRSQRALSCEGSEVEMLRWDDIDLDAHTVTVRHGKADKRRIADVTDATMLALYALW